MGLRILSREKLTFPPVTEEAQFAALVHETRNWQNSHRNEDKLVEEEFIQQYKTAKQRLQKSRPTSHSMLEAAERLNLSIRKEETKGTCAGIKVDVATLMELLNERK
jgi:methylthioribose-1-phosphate isomerase